jgi:glucose-1-phosphate adenylyltransferase
VIGRESVQRSASSACSGSGAGWYQGTADAIYQNLGIVQDEGPRQVAVFGGDHIYKMDYSEMLAFHIGRGALGTVAAIEISRGEASAFGIMEVDHDWRITGFEEKPKSPKPMPGGQSCEN